MRALLLLLLPLVVIGCTDSAATAPKKTSRADFDAALSKTPVPRTYTIDGHQLLVLDIPLGVLGRYVEHQRCFVWRDSEFRTASIQCPSDAADIDIGRTQDTEINP